MTKPALKSTDILLWGLVLLLFSAAIGGNLYFSYFPVIWRAVSIVGMLGVTVFLALQTVQGKKAWSFIRASRAELRQIIWPTRQETLQVTLIVTVLILLTSFVLWAIDSVLMRMMSWLTGA